MIDLSIVIVSMNIKDLLRKCLSSVFAKEGKKINYEVFVVDNASSDGTPEMVSKEFPQVKVIKNKENSKTRLLLQALKMLENSGRNLKQQKPTAA